VAGNGTIFKETNVLIKSVESLVITHLSSLELSPLFPNRRSICSEMNIDVPLAPKLPCGLQLLRVQGTASPDARARETLRARISSCGRTGHEWPSRIFFTVVLAASMPPASSCYSDFRKSRLRSSRLLYYSIYYSNHQDRSWSPRLFQQISIDPR
jgi:hypothetical protein